MNGEPPENVKRDIAKSVSVDNEINRSMFAVFLEMELGSSCSSENIDWRWCDRGQVEQPEMARQSLMTGYAKKCVAGN